jgi:hypothetical protein
LYEKSFAWRVIVAGQQDDDLIAAFLDRWENSTSEQRGMLAWALLGNALLTLALYGAIAGDVAVSAARVWRRRDMGWRVALTRGPCWRSMATLATVGVVHRLVSRALTQRAAHRQ